MATKATRDPSEVSHALPSGPVSGKIVSGALAIKTRCADLKGAPTVVEMITETANALLREATRVAELEGGLECPRREFICRVKS